MTGEAYDELWNIDWVAIPDFQYVMKYKFDEDSYTLMISDLAAVYGEKLDEKAIQGRFQILNPYAEMLPKVILKHVKQSIKSIMADEENELTITLLTNQVNIQHQFNISGVRFVFNFEPQMLSDNQFKAHILRPTLLRTLTLHEEKAALQRKVEKLEGRLDPSSSSYSERKNIKAIYSEIKKSDPAVPGIIRAFLYLQKDKIILPESLEGTPNVSPTKGIYSSSTSPSPRNRIKDSKNITRNIPYKEDDSDMSLESQNTIQQSEEPEISIKIEKTEEADAEMSGFDDLVNNLSAKIQNVKESNKCVSPTKREMAEEDSKEESAPKPMPYLKPSLPKKKKLLKF